MTSARRHTLAQALAIGGGVVAAACVVLLTVDYVRARRGAAPDAERIAALQAQVQRDATASGALAAEHDRITRTRQSRKARADSAAIVLIAGAVAFVVGAKWHLALGGRRPAVTIVPVARVSVAERALARDMARRPAGRSAGVAGEPDLAIVEAIVRREGTTGEAAIPILQAIQAHYRYLPDAALARVCELTAVTPAQIAGTSSFYARFRRSPVGKHVVRVCHGTACHVSGARQITDELRRALEIPDGADTDPRGMFTIDEVACVGCCSLAPVLMLDQHTVGRLTAATACTALDEVVAARDAADATRKEPA